MTVLSAESNSSKRMFLSSDLKEIDLLTIPKHIAVIMDGNRRWAKQKGLLPAMGHWAGAETLMHVVKAAAELGIKTVTAYAFSTENWNRSEEEIDALMELFELYLNCKKDQMVEEGVRLDMIGCLGRFPQYVQDAFALTKAATSDCRKISLVLALNYGARDEIRRAIVKILELNKKKPVLSEQITEEMVASHLDTHPWGDPELMIRTSGELRMSNFLLWQISYTEIIVTEKLWPDFSSRDLLEAVITFQNRARRLGRG